MHHLVIGLAKHHGEADEVQADAEDLARVLFEPEASVHADLAVDDDGTVVGMAVWYRTYSTWRGRHGIWLEDLVVDPDHRGAGIGRALLAALARRCVDSGYARLEWNVVDDNDGALAFYATLGSQHLSTWQLHRLDGERLALVARSADAS